MDHDDGNKYLLYLVRLLSEQVILVPFSMFYRSKYAISE